MISSPHEMLCKCCSTLNSDCIFNSQSPTTVSQNTISSNNKFGVDYSLDKAADFPQTKLPEQWISFVQHTTRGGYRCLWESCEYEADKQRLKRHIENTHLKIRLVI